MLPGIRCVEIAYLFRCTGDDDLTAAIAALRTQVDDVIGYLNDIQVVLNDQDAVASIDQALEDFDQLVNVGSVQADGRFIENVQRAAGGAAGELARELDALGLAA